MLKKHAIFVTVFVCFSLLTLSAFAQNDTEPTAQERISGVAQMRSAVEKLKKGMTVAEVEELIGKPTFESSSYYYWFNNEEYIRLNYIPDNRLYSVYNRKSLNIFELTHRANTENFPVIIDGKEMKPLHPVMHIFGDIYISIKDFEAAFGVTVTFGEEKQQSATDVVEAYIPTTVTGVYKATIANFSVFIDGKELFTVSPVMIINDEAYIPIEELEEDFQIKAVRVTTPKLYVYQYQYASQPPTITSLEIKTGVPFVADLNNRKNHLAMVTNCPVFINEKEFLTLNPTVVINGKIYLPMEDLQEYLEIAAYRDSTTEFVLRSGLPDTYVTTIHSIDIVTGKNEILLKNEEIQQKKELDGIIEPHFLSSYQPSRSIRIIKTGQYGVQSEKEHVGVIKFKEDVAKLEKGMPREEVEQILGETKATHRVRYDILREMIYPYRHEDGEILNLIYDGHGLSAVENWHGIDILATGYNAHIPHYPILINGEKPLIKNPILNISEITYIPIEDFSEYFNINVSFNEEKQQLEIVSKTI